MSTVGVPQRKRSQASRVGSTTTTKSTANSASTQPARANSIAAMPSSAQFRRNTGTSTNTGTGKKMQTEVWDPFQFDCVKPGNQTSCKDLLYTINEERRRGPRGQTNNSCRPRPCPMPCSLPRNYCDSGESDSTVSDSGRRTTDFLFEMWCQQKLCDVMIRCSSEGNAEDTILAHKVH